MNEIVVEKKKRSIFQNIFDAVIAIIILGFVTFVLAIQFSAAVPQ